MALRIGIASLLLMLVASTSADAQRGRRGSRWAETIPSWGVESSYRVSVLKDDAVSYVGARIGRQLDAVFNVGIGGSMLLTGSAESLRADGFDRVTSLVYLGPSIALRDSLRGPARLLFRATAVIGLVGFEESFAGIATSGSSIVYGFEPEAGVSIRVTRALHAIATVGALFGWRAIGGGQVVSGPTASFGVSIVR